MELTIGRLALRPLTEASYPWLYDLAVSRGVGERWRWRGVHPSPEAFTARLWEDCYQQFVVYDTLPEQDHAIGLLQAYRANFAQNHCYVSVIFDEGVHGSGWHLRAVDLFLDHLFNSCGFVKLYGETFGDNMHQFATVGRAELFREEMRLPDFAIVAGSPVDYIVLAATRERWSENVGRMFHRGGTTLASRLRLASERSTPE